MLNKKLPTVVIIGRINVGKSLLFNRLSETTKAIVSNVPGTTRDYNIGQISWQRKTFNLIDTGGINIDILKNSIQDLLIKKEKKTTDSSQPIALEILKQTKKALAKADLILMVTDVQSGLLPQDKELGLVIKKLKKPTLLVVNKADSPKWRLQTNDFFKLGLGNPLAVSAINGSGTGDLLDEVVKNIKMPRGRPATKTAKSSIKVTIIGKPNVGKSSLVNQILGEERVIVSATPQTTRDPQDTEIEYKNQLITLIDTAGLRKRAKEKPGIERLSSEKTMRRIKQADVVVLITEAQASLVTQDRRLMGMIIDCQAGIILVANKWDLIPDKTTQSAAQLERYYRRSLPAFDWAPMIFTSAKTGQGVNKVLDLVLEVWRNRQKEVDQDKLDEALTRFVQQKRPVKARGQNRPRIKKISQTKSNPPEFTIKLGPDQSVHSSYLRFLQNQIRKNFGFLGVPVRIRVEKEE